MRSRLILALNIEIHAKRFERLFNSEEPMCALLVSAADARGLISGTVNRSLWNRSLIGGGLQGPMWLYAYEGLRHDLIGHASTAHIEQDPYFSILRARRVCFFSVEAGLTAITGVNRARRRADNLHQAWMRQEFGKGFDVEEWEVGDADKGSESGFDSDY